MGSIVPSLSPPSFSLCLSLSLVCLKGGAHKCEYNPYQRLLEMCVYVNAEPNRNQSENKSFTAKSTRTYGCVRKANGEKFMAFTSMWKVKSQLEKKVLGFRCIYGRVLSHIYSTWRFLHATMKVLKGQTLWIECHSHSYIVHSIVPNWGAWCRASKPFTPLLCFLLSCVIDKRNDEKWQASIRSDNEWWSIGKLTQFQWKITSKES